AACSWVWTPSPGRREKKEGRGDPWHRHDFRADMSVLATRLLSAVGEDGSSVGRASRPSSVRRAVSRACRPRAHISPARHFRGGGNPRILLKAHDFPSFL